MKRNTQNAVLEQFVKLNSSHAANELKTIIGGFQILESEYLEKILSDHFEKDRILNRKSS